jgi:hypothetical protein
VSAYEWLGLGRDAAASSAFGSRETSYGIMHRVDDARCMLPKENDSAHVKGSLTVAAPETKALDTGCGLAGSAWAVTNPGHM